MAKNDKKTVKENKHFFKDFKAEIKKVIWPSSKQLVNTTIAIITMVIVVSAIVFVLDLVFDASNKYGLTKLQESVRNVNSVSSESENNTIDSQSSIDEETVQEDNTTSNNNNEVE